MKTKNSTCRVKVGVIGTGAMGQRHCRIYANLHGAQLAGITDTNLERGQQIAQQHNTSFFEDIETLLNNVDAVSLVTPTPAHFDLAKLCLEKGVHVLVEKPFTKTLEQAEILTRMAEANGTIVQVGHIERFNPAYTELKNVLESLDLVALNLRRLSAFEASNTDVDVILDLMIHDIDLVLDLMGEQPVTVNACGMSVFSDTIDYAIAQLCFPSGQLVTLNASRVTEQKVRSIEATAVEAYVESNLLNKSISVHRRTNTEYLSQSKGVKYRQESVVEYIHVPAFEPLFLELEHFITCVKENKLPQVSARAGYNALKWALAIQTAVKKQIALKQTLPQLATETAISFN